MKKLLFVIPEYSHGGTNKSLENLLVFLDKKKYDISIFCLYEDGGDYYKKVFAPYILKKSLLYYWLHDNPVTRKVIGFINKVTKKDNFGRLYQREAHILQSKYHFDTIIAYQEGTATEFAASVKNCKKRVAWYHCPYIQYDEKQKYIAEKLYNQFDGIACVSQCFVELFTNEFPILKSKIHCIYNTLNNNLINKMGNEPLNDDYFQPDCFTILSVGRLTRQKQFEKIPELVNKLSKKTDNRFKWFIIASGDSCKKCLLANIRKYQVEDKVILLGSRDNPYPYFRNSDLYVCTSDSESFSYTIFESKILHTPVLSNDFPVAYEVVDKLIGWITNIKEMPQLLSRIIDNVDGEYDRKKKAVMNYTYDNHQILQDIDQLLQN